MVSINTNLQKNIRLSLRRGQGEVLTRKGSRVANPFNRNQTTNPCHCEEPNVFGDEAIQLMLHKYNNFAQKKTVNKKLDRRGLIALAMTAHRFLPLSGEVRRGVNSFTQSLNHLLTCSLPERRYVW